MNTINSAELKFPYSWTAIRPDDPRRTGFPDSTLLNRGEGYEVLDFINRYCALHTWENPSGPATKATAQKVERMIRHVPGNLRSHSNVTGWIETHWSSYA